MPIKFAITGDNKGFLNSMDGVRSSVRSTMQDVEKSGMGVEQMFDRLKKAAALSFAGFSAKELIGNIMDVRGQFQQLEVAFKTMLGSEEKATKLMDQLVKTAATTPFDLKGVADGAKMLLAYGTEVENVNEMLVRLGDVAAGMSIQLGDLVYLYGTTMVQGRMFTQDLRQFQGRGIPIAEEIAKVLNVTKNEIPELVTAGKVTADVFHQAFVNMTNEGSKFGGLMAEQSKTIKGQISNIEDAVDMMFNEMGKKSEGAINTGLGAVSYIVENWQKVGEAIGVAAVGIGSYKAVMVAVNAVQKANNALMAESVVQQALATAAGHALTAGQARQAAMDVLLTNTRRSLIAATKELAAATLLNPYVLTAAAITTLVVLTYKLATAEDAETIARRKANEEMQKFSDGLDEQKNKIQGYIQTLQDTSATEYEKAVAWEMLTKLAPTLTEKYDKEALAVLDLAEANRELNEQMDEKKFEHIKEKVDELRKKYEETKNTIKNSSGAGQGLLAKLLSNIENRNLNSVGAELDVYVSKLLEIQRIRQRIEENNKPIEIRVKEANDNVQAKEEIYKFYKKAADLAGELKEAHDIAAGTIANNSIPTDFEKVADDVRRKYDELISELQEDVEELRRKVAQSPADIKLQVALEEKQKALDDILRMKADWQVNGVTTIPLYFQIHYTEAEEGLKSAKDNGAEGMYFNYVTQRYESIKATVPQKTPAQYKAEAYNKWKQAEKNLNDFYNKKEQVDEETFKKTVEDLQTKVDEAKKNYQKYGGSTSSKKSTGKDDSAKRKAAILQESRRWEEEMDKLEEQSRNARTEANLASIREEGERERKERDHQHKLRLQEIADEADEMRKAIYEHNKRIWENEHKDGVYEETKEGKNGWKTLSLTKEQQELIDALTEKENAEYRNVLADRLEADKQYMISYLKEYGSIQQQKEAITKEYDERIEKESNAVRKAALQKEREQLISELNMKQLKDDIDWEAVFGDLGKLTTRALKELKGKLKEALSDKDITPENAAVIAESIYKIETKISERTDVWESILPALRKRKELILEAAESEEKLRDYTKEVAALSVKSMSDLSKIQSNIEAKANGKIVGLDEISKMTSDEYVKLLNLDPLSEAGMKAAGEFDKLIISTKGLEKAQASLSAEQKHRQNVTESLNNFKDLKGVFNAVFDFSDMGMTEIVNLADKNAKSMAEFVDKIGAGETDFGQAVHAFSEGVSGFNSAIQSLQSGDVFGAVNGILDGISGYARAVTIGLFGTGNVEEYEKEVRKLRESNEYLKKSIDSLADVVSKSTSTNEESVAAYQRQLKAAEEWQKNQLEAINKRASESSNTGHGFLGMSGKSSFNKHMAGDDWSGWEVFSEILKSFYGTAIGYEHRSVNKSTIWELTPEEMKLLQSYAPEEWRKLMSGDGENNPIELINEYIEQAGKIEELTESLNKKLTGYSFEGFSDSYKSTLKDLTSDTKVFGDNIEEIITNALLENLVNEEFRKRLQELYKYIADSSRDGLDEDEIKEIRRINKEISDAMIARRQDLIDAGFIKKSSDAYKQEASAKGFNAMSQDTGDELNGRFTAVQISSEVISQNMIRAAESLTSILSTGTSIAGDVAEIRALVFTSTGYLEDMVRYAKLTYVRMGGTLEDIANNTKNM